MAHLLRAVEHYLKDRNIAASRFGREATHDPRFVFDLRRGREPRPETQLRVLAFIGTVRTETGEQD